MQEEGSHTPSPSNTHRQRYACVQTYTHVYAHSQACPPLSSGCLPNMRLEPFLWDRMGCWQPVFSGWCLPPGVGCGIWTTVHASGWSLGSALASACVSAWDRSCVTPLHPGESPRLHPSPALHECLGLPKSSQLSLSGRTLPPGLKPWRP